jgi:hypothetical protein
MQNTETGNWQFTHLTHIPYLASIHYGTIVKGHLLKRVEAVCHRDLLSQVSQHGT